MPETNWAMLGREAKVARIIAALDAVVGHQATLEEAHAIGTQAWQKVLSNAKATGDRKPSKETIDLLAATLRRREELPLG